MNLELERELVRDVVIEFLTTTPEFYTTVEYLSENIPDELPDGTFDALADRVHSKAEVIIRNIAHEWMENNND